jgi:hypothetical protein
VTVTVAIFNVLVIVQFGAGNDTAHAPPADGAPLLVAVKPDGGFGASVAVQPGSLPVQPLTVNEAEPSPVIVCGLGESIVPFGARFVQVNVI